MAKAKFPKRLGEYNTYLIAAVPYLDAAKARLAVSNENMDALNLLFDNSASGNGWMQVYPLTQSRATATGALRDQRNNLRKLITAKLREIYGDVPESALTETDRNTLRIFERDLVPSKRPVITTQPSVTLKPIGGGKIHIECRVESDSTRPSMHPDADLVELRYMVGDPPPETPAAALSGFNSSRSNWIQPVDLGDRGKTFYCYARWANTSDESKSGPWSQRYQVIVA